MRQGWSRQQVAALFDLAVLRICVGTVLGTVFCGTVFRGTVFRGTVSIILCNGLPVLDNSGLSTPTRG
jgi:hypothetical protein